MAADLVDGEILAMHYTLWLNGLQCGMDKKQCIESIQIKETVNGANSATVNITDPEFLFIEDNIFTEDTEVKIEMGWVGTNHLVTFNGFIASIDITFGDNGVPKLVITCMDETHIMNRVKRDSTYKKKKADYVVKKVAKRYGFKTEIQKKYKFEKKDITQSNQTDAEFLNNLASQEVYPFSFRLVGNTIYYVKKGELGDPKMSLWYVHYPHEIISFSPKVNTETKQVESKYYKQLFKKKKVRKGMEKSGKYVGDTYVSMGDENTENNNVNSKRTYSTVEFDRMNISRGQVVPSAPLVWDKKKKQWVRQEG